MNVRHLAARTAIAGVTTALAAGALVGVSTVAANAGTAVNAYTCVTPVGSQESTLTVTGVLPVPEYSAGAPVPAGLVAVTASVDATTAGTLASFGATSLRVDDFSVSLGKGKVEIPLSGSITAGKWAGAGKNKAFVTPAAGDVVAAVMPQAMTVTAVLPTGDIALNCTLKAGETAQTVATIKLNKQDTATVVAKKATAKKGKLAKVSVKVKGAGGGIAAGNVVVKEGKKVVGKAKLSTKGAAVVKLGKKLKVGKHNLTVSYAGNDTFNASKAKVKLTVKK